MSFDLEREIDRAVRSLLDEEPSNALRARVMDRISAGERRRPSLWTVMAAGAAAAAVLLAFWIVRRPVTPTTSQPVTSVAARSTAASPLPAVAPAKPMITTAASGPVTRAGGERPEPRAQRMAALKIPPAPASFDANVAPLPAQAPVRVSAIETPPIETPSVSIAPLQPIDPITVEPLSREPGRL